MPAPTTTASDELEVSSPLGAAQPAASVSDGEEGRGGAERVHVRGLKQPACHLRHEGVTLERARSGGAAPRDLSNRDLVTGRRGHGYARPRARRAAAHARAPPARAAEGDSTTVPTTSSRSIVVTARGPRARTSSSVTSGHAPRRTRAPISISAKVSSGAMNGKDTFDAESTPRRYRAAETGGTRRAAAPVQAPERRDANREADGDRRGRAARA